MMGDRRDRSVDSRCHLADVTPAKPRGAAAFVPETLIAGKAIAIAAPIDRLRWMKRPAIFDDVPAAQEPAPAEAAIQPAEVTC